MKIVRRTTFAVLALAVLFLVEAGAATAQTPSLPPSATRAAALDALTASVRPTRAASAEMRVQGQEPVAPQPRVAVTDGNYIRHLSARATGVFPVRAAVKSPEILQSPEKMAHVFLAENRSLFVADSPKTAFVTKAVKSGPGCTYVRIGQSYNGLPVFGAEAVVQIRGAEGVMAVSSKLMSETAPLDNGLITTGVFFTADEAKDAAILALADDYPGTALTSEAADLRMIFDPTIVGQKGLPQPVWNVHVNGVDNMFPNELVLVSGTTGQVVLHYSLTRGLKYRSVYDGGGALGICPAGNPLDNRFYYQIASADQYGSIQRWEEENYWLNLPKPIIGPGPPFGWPKGPFPLLDIAGMEINPDANLVYYYLGCCYDYYYNHFRRISIDNGLQTHPAPDSQLATLYPGFITYPSLYTTSGTLVLADDRIGMEISATYNMAGQKAYWEGFWERPDAIQHSYIGWAHMFDRIYLGTVTASGTGMFSSDTIMHEYTHGVDTYESKPIYVGQTASIEEAYADMFGVWMRQEYPSNISTTNILAGGLDPTKWLLGAENGLPTSPFQLMNIQVTGLPTPEYDSMSLVTLANVTSNLRNPPDYGMADRVGSKFYYRGPADFGGAHTNAGIVEKLAYLLSYNQADNPNGDPEEFNGQTVISLGTAVGNLSAPQLFYTAQTGMLTPASNFEDLYYALLQAGETLGYSDMYMADIERACRAVEIAPARLSDAYTITYKDKNPSIQVQVEDRVGQTGVNAILIVNIVNGAEDPSAVGSLKIRRKPGLDTYPTIQLIESAGSFDKIYCEGSVRKVISGGVIRNIAMKDGYARRIEANEVGNVKMDSTARSWSTSMAPSMGFWTTLPTSQGLALKTSGLIYEYYGEMNLASIYTGDISGSPIPNPMPMKVNLVGTGLYSVMAPDQEVSLQMASKKWLQFATSRDRQTEDISYAGLLTPKDARLTWFNYTFINPFVFVPLVDPYFRGDNPIRGYTGNFNVGHLNKLSTKGAGMSFGYIEWSRTLAPLLGNTSVSASAQTYTLAYNPVTTTTAPQLQQTTHLAIVPGTVEGDLLETNSKSTSIRSDGGYVAIGSTVQYWGTLLGVYTQGSISEISAHTKMSRAVQTVLTTDSATSVTTSLRTLWEVHLLGAVGWYHYNKNTEGTTFLVESTYWSGRAGNTAYADIGRIWGDAGAQGTFKAGTQLITDPATGLPTYINLGSIGSIGTPAHGLSVVPGGASLIGWDGVMAMQGWILSITGPLATPSQILPSDRIYMGGNLWSARPPRITGGDSSFLAHHYGP